MTFTFKKGKHRAIPLYWLKWWPIMLGPRDITRKVWFGFESRYAIGEDQADHNKLFGVAFGGVHKKSARFGWRYDAISLKFILSAYCYVNGERIMRDICDCGPNKWYTCILSIRKRSYLFNVYEGKSAVSFAEIKNEHNRQLGFLLGPYFGGNRTAPVKVTIDLKK